MIMNETRLWTAKFHPVLIVVYATTVFCARTKMASRIAFKSRHVTSPSHILVVKCPRIIHEFLFQMLLGTDT